MRAAADDAEILSKLVRIQKMYVPATGGTTAPLTADADEDTLLLDILKTGFAAGNYVLVGDGTRQHLNQLGTIPADDAALPILLPLPIDYLIGDKVRKAIAVDLGYIEEGSASLGASSSTTSVGAANAGGNIYTSAPQVGDLTASWGQRATSPENILSAYGIDETTVKGNGTTNDPYRAWIHPNNMGTQRLFAYRLTGQLADNRFAYLDLLNPTPQVNISTAFGAKNAPAVWTVSCVYTHKFLHYST